MSVLRYFVVLPFVFLPVSQLDAKSLPPKEALAKMKPADGFSVRLIASEPTIRQPVSMSFDDLGRLWVHQYLQYPTPAGLKPVSQDRYLRTIWDKVPEPPPHGPKGKDILTILYDADEHGVYRKSKDFLTGLSITSGFCLGRGGVFVLQTPYLLYYADKNHDDKPDGDPEVLLSGFGMNDTHSLANSLQWGPDGWLYGAAGSTSTCIIRNPAGKPSDAPIEFQQGIWRYHPEKKIFELFSEGGGNTYGLDFDINGHCIAGTNYGNKAMLHQYQGAYHVKGFSKHGPLHNPYTYGYFDHVPYTGFKGGHVTCGGVMYLSDEFPEEMRNQYIAANVLSNAIYWHKMERTGSTYKASHGGDLLTTSDQTFRPIDLMLAPDGSITIADWTDPRIAHLDPVDNWEKSTGRIYRLENAKTQWKPYDLRKATSAELVNLLSHKNAWWRKEARCLLTDRHDATTYPMLKKLIETENGLLALEAAWALYSSGGYTDEFGLNVMSEHPNPRVREWFVRFTSDLPNSAPSSAIVSKLEQMCASETDPMILAQLACSAKRLPAKLGLQLAFQLQRRSEIAGDPFLPLLTWWTIEGHLDAEPAYATRQMLDLRTERPQDLTLLRNLVQRLLTDGKHFAEYKQIVETELDPTKGSHARLAAVVSATEASLTSGKVPLSKDLFTILATFRERLPNDDAPLRMLASRDHADAVAEVRRRVTDTKLPVATRLKWLPVIAQSKLPGISTLWLDMLKDAGNDAMRIGLLDACASSAAPHTAERLLKLYPSFSPAVRKKTIAVLLSRGSWAVELLTAYDAGAIPKEALGLDQARIASGLNDAAVTKLVEKHWGKIGAATAGEKQARIAWLKTMLGRVRPPDLAAGHKLFALHCAVCHTFNMEGGKLGPDLTTADRKNRDYMLHQIVDPSGHIRPEFINHKVSTLDGRTLTGLISKSDASSITLVNVVENKPVELVIAQKDIDEMTPLPTSLMPEKLLEPLTYEQVGDLFAFLASDVGVKASASAEAPVNTKAPAEKNRKKLRLALVSGSLEYKSNESLAKWQTSLEKNFAVECVRLFSETDQAIDGLDRLSTCDAAVFFTRRMKIDGKQLNFVKAFADSGKPIVGIRTASHGFQNWLAMDPLVFGGNYKGHTAQNVVAKVTPRDAAKKHPVLNGVKPFQTLGGLYKNPDLPNDLTILLTASNGKETEPVAWVRERAVHGKTQRVFYTSLGTPGDFTDANFLRLIENGLVWACDGALTPAK